MKRISFILCIITFSFLFSACQAVNVNSADELLHSVWYVENINTMKAKLSFDVPTNTASFIITDQNGEETQICGVFAVDKNNVFITSQSLKNTYAFGYTVYKDRLILTYNGTELIFSAEK